MACAAITFAAVFGLLLAQPAVKRRVVRVVRKLESLCHRGHDDGTLAEESERYASADGGGDGDGDGGGGVGISIDKGGEKTEARPPISSHPGSTHSARGRSELL